MSIALYSMCLLCDKTEIGSSFEVFAHAFDGLIVISSIVFSTLGLLGMLSMPPAACYAFIGVGGGVLLLDIPSEIVLFYKHCTKNKNTTVYQHLPHLPPEVWIEFCSSREYS